MVPDAYTRAPEAKGMGQYVAGGRGHAVPQGLHHPVHGRDRAADPLPTLTIVLKHRPLLKNPPDIQVQILGGIDFGTWVISTGTPASLQSVFSLESKVSRLLERERALRGEPLRASAGTGEAGGEARAALARRFALRSGRQCAC